MKKKILTSVLCCLLAVGCFVSGVFAASNIKEITAHINYGLGMKVDNQVWTPTEEDGSAIRPITYKGRTYLPVRALGEKFNMVIDYDAETQTVLIGEKEWTPITADMVQSYNAGFTKDPDALFCGNGVYDFGVAVESKWLDNEYSEFVINLDEKYTTMKLSGFALGEDRVVKVFNTTTKEVYKTFTLKAGEPAEFEFSVACADQIEFNWDGDNGATALVFGDIYVK